MNKLQQVLRNSSLSFLSQIINIIIQFIIRVLVIRYLGVEIVGISSTFSSLLNALSLAELGFQTAIIYSLYKPLVENDYEKINDLANIYRFFYTAIGFFFLIMAALCVPFIPFLLKGVEVTFDIYIIWFLQAISVACTYFCSYRRSILYANQKEYVYKIIDLFFNVFFGIVQVFILTFVHNYHYYLCIQILKVIFSNVIINNFCKKNYPFLSIRKINKDMFSEVYKNVKNIFASKVAGCVNGATNNLVVSTLLSTISTGFMTNYSMIASNIKIISNSILNPIMPFIGEMLGKKENNVNYEEQFLFYTFIRTSIAGGLVVPFIVLADLFIEIFYGESYIIEGTLVILMGLDIYIHIVHSACCDYITCAGLFAYDKKIEIIGAMCNVVSSVIGALIIGLEGVWVGTIISQIYFWIARVRLVYSKCFHKKSYRKYVTMNLYYGFVIIIMGIIATKVSEMITIRDRILSFIIKGCVCEILMIGAMGVLSIKNSNYKQFIKVINRNLRSIPVIHK